MARKQVGAQVRAGWRGRGGAAFTRGWWAGRPGWNAAHWRYHRGWGRYPARFWWRPITAVALTGWFSGWWSQPVYQDYGQSIYYQGDTVYNNNQVVATADEYYQQASTIAQDAPKVDAEKAEWLPLGVFAVTKPDSAASNMVLQLAVSKEGVIAGTFYNETTEATHPVEGQVDKKTQRAAWRCTDGSNPDLVMETSIYNLTKDEASILVHFGKDRTQEMLLVRLPDPEASKE